MGFDWNNVKGFREAARLDALEREAAFLVPPEFICGMEVKPFTLRHIQILRALESPFFMGGVSSEIDCARFLWVVSLKYREVDSWWDSFVRCRFYRSIGRLNYGEAIKQIHDYIALAFRDSPGETRGPIAETYWSFSASIVDAIGTSYGWTIKEIQGVPLRQIFQLLKVARKRINPDAPMFSHHTARVKTNYRRERNERMQAQGKEKSEQ